MDKTFRDSEPRPSSSTSATFTASMPSEVITNTGRSALPQCHAASDQDHQGADGGLEIEMPDGYPLRPQNDRARPLIRFQMAGMIQLQNILKVRHPDWSSEQLQTAATNALQRVMAKQQRIQAIKTSMSRSPKSVSDGLEIPIPQQHSRDSSREDSGYYSYVECENNDATSIKTMLSDASPVFRLPGEHGYFIAAFVNDFHEDTKILDLSVQARARTNTHLSELLKMFSLRLEDTARSQKERDTKDFIRRQRGYVLPYFTELELICHSRITDYIRNFGNAVDVPVVPKSEVLPQEAMYFEDKVDSRDANEHIDQASIPPRYQEVRFFLLESSAYKLLCERTRSAVALTDVKHSATDKISRIMGNLLTTLR
jgi:hypothetical protein